MFNIEFWEDKNGFSDVSDFIEKLSKKKDKSSRVNLRKIVAYIDTLFENGNTICYPVARHIEDEIWELRPLNNRFMYAYITGNKIIILSHFIKKTNKTPKLEIDKAKRRLDEYKKRKNWYKKIY